MSDKSAIPKPIRSGYLYFCQFWNGKCVGATPLTLPAHMVCLYNRVQPTLSNIHPTPIESGSLSFCCPRKLSTLPVPHGTPLCMCGLLSLPLCVSLCVCPPLSLDLLFYFTTAPSPQRDGHQKANLSPLDRSLYTWMPSDVLTVHSTLHSADHVSESDQDRNQNQLFWHSVLMLTSNLSLVNSSF